MENKKRMSNKEAREIVGRLSHFVMYQMGVIDDPISHLKASLPDLLKADQKVRALNKVQEKGKPRTLQTTVADRGIAAMYTAMSFEGGTPSEPNIVGYANGNYVMVIRESSFRKTKRPSPGKEGKV